MAKSFPEKNAIRKHLKPRIEYSKFAESQQKIWRSFIDDAMSFVIKDKTGRIVGVCLNHLFSFEMKQKPHNGDVFSDMEEYYRFVVMQTM